MERSSDAEVLEEESFGKVTKRAIKLAEAGDWDSSLTIFNQALTEEHCRSKRRDFTNSYELVKDCNRWV